MGTAGCVGLPEARVRALQEFQTGAVLAVLPETALIFPGLLTVATVRPPMFTGGNR
jgi:hypothetical protein